MKVLRSVGLPGLFLLALLVLLGTSALRAGESGGEYAGSEVCAGCHEEIAKAIEITTHGKTSRSNWDGGTGCESCHGPGKAHADAGGDATQIKKLKTLGAQEVAKTCLGCHEKGARANWKGSPHDGRGLSCTTCHKIHQGAKPNPRLLAKATEFETCTSCHLKKKAALQRSAHMPLREGTMTCSSCHNPHGSNGPSQLKQYSVNENCYSCHQEKRAPVLWEHPPVKENCLNCHDPHGSLHPGMLNAKRPRLCQQCHDEMRHPTQPYDSAQSTYFFPTKRVHYSKSCVSCHAAVHGSNHPSGVRFMR